MLRSFLIAITLASVGSAAFAIELREDLPFVKGRYATTEDCKILQSFEAKGEKPNLQNAAWHLTSEGFTDGWEQACSFHAVFVRGTAATAQAICSAGADTTLKSYLFFLQDMPKDHPDIYVHEEEGASGADTQGVQYSWCPSGKPSQ